MDLDRPELNKEVLQKDNNVKKVKYIQKQLFDTTPYGVGVRTEEEEKVESQ